MTLYSGSFDRTIKIWDVITGDCTKELTGHSDKVLTLSLSSDNLLVGYENKRKKKNKTTKKEKKYFSFLIFKNMI